MKIFCSYSTETTGENGKKLQNTSKSCSWTAVIYREIILLISFGAVPMLHNVTEIPACSQPRCLIFIAFTWDWELRMGCDRISFFVRYLGSPNALLPDDVLPLCLDYTALHQALEKHSVELVDFSRLSCLIWSNYDHCVFFNNDAIWLCLTNHHWFKIQLKFIFAFLAGGAVREKWVEMFKTKMQDEQCWRRLS